MIVPTAALRWRVHWVIAELDVRGEIDPHAAMCLRHAIDAAHSSAVEMILVDLRDLTAINPAALAQFTQHSAECCAHGIDLGLLISDAERNGQITEAFVLAGLGDQLLYAAEVRPPTALHPVRLLDHTLSVRRGRLARAAGRCSPRRRPLSRTT